MATIALVEKKYLQPPDADIGNQQDGKIVKPDQGWIRIARDVDLSFDDARALIGPLFSNEGKQVLPDGTFLVARWSLIHQFPRIPGKRDFTYWRHLLLRVRNGAPSVFSEIGRARMRYDNVELILQEGTDFKPQATESAKAGLMRKYPDRAERISKSSILLFAFYLREHGLLGGPPPPQQQSTDDDSEPRRRIDLPS